MKYALVTGGSRGIGRAVCIKLSQMGYHILVNYKANKAEAQRTLEMIEQQNGHATLLPFDVSRQEEVESVLSEWMGNNKEAYIEVLINNAGIRKDNLLVFMENEHWFDVINTNLHSFYYITRWLIKKMLLKKYGRIVNIVSLSGIKGLPGQVNYAAAKAGVIAATKSLAQEVGKKNVTVNAVAPGFIKTEMTKDMNEDELKRLIPLNRFGNIEEVAAVAGFLASPEASYVTGEVISVNGGLYT